MIKAINRGLLKHSHRHKSTASVKLSFLNDEGIFPNIRISYNPVAESWVQALFDAVSLLVVFKKVLCASSYPTFFKTMHTLLRCSAKPCVRSTCVPPPRSNVPSNRANSRRANSRFFSVALFAFPLHVGFSDGALSPFYFS